MVVNAENMTGTTSVPDEAPEDGVSPELGEAWTKALSDEPEESSTPEESPKETETESTDTSDDDGKGPESSTGTEESGDSSESQGTEVSERLIQAGRRAKLSDEVIVEYATNNPAVLEQLAVAQEQLSADFGELGRQKQSLQQQEKPAVDKPAVEPFKLDLDPEKFDEDTIALMKPMVDEINKLRTAAKVNEDSVQASQDAQSQGVMKAIDTCFDARMEAHPQLGNSESLTAEQQEFRVDMVNMAEQKANRWNAAHPDDLLSMDRAIDMALSVMGTNETAVEKRIVEKLGKTKKLFIARPTSHKKNAPVMKDDDAAVHAVQEYAEQHGIDNLK